MSDQFKSMKYNPFRDPNKTMDELYPDLFRYDEFRNLKRQTAWNKVAKYILLLYSKDTELLQEHPDNLKNRKEAAATMAGFVCELDGVWPPDAAALMEIRNKTAAEATLRFLKHQKHIIWTEITIIEEELSNFQMLRFNPIELGKKKSKKKKNPDGSPGGDTGEDEDSSSKNRQKEIYEAANRKDDLMDACSKRIKALEGLYVQFYGDSKKDLTEAEFEEAVTPENCLRIIGEMESPFKEEVARA